jgi:hypothetical protein
MPLGDIDFNTMVLTTGTMRTRIEETGAWTILFMQEVCKVEAGKTKWVKFLHTTLEYIGPSHFTHSSSRGKRPSL